MYIILFTYTILYNLSRNFDSSRYHDGQPLTSLFHLRHFHTGLNFLHADLQLYKQDNITN